MKVHNKIGSKERLLEMFENVNKIKINESIVDEKWGKDVEVPKSEKGKHTNKTVEELRSQLANAKKGGDTDTVKELNFAIRAKTGWGKVSETNDKKMVWGDTGINRKLNIDDEVPTQSTTAKSIRKQAQDLYNKENNVSISKDKFNEEYYDEREHSVDLDPNNFDQIRELYTILSDDKIEDIYDYYPKWIVDLLIDNGFIEEIDFAWGFTEEGRNTFNSPEILQKYILSNANEVFTPDPETKVFNAMQGGVGETAIKEDILDDEEEEEEKADVSNPVLTGDDMKDMDQEEPEIDGNASIEEPETPESEFEPEPETGVEVEPEISDEPMPIEQTEYDPDQVMIGIKIEMANNGDPHTALDVVMNNLVDIPDFYTSQGVGVGSDAGIDDGVNSTAIGGPVEDPMPNSEETGEEEEEIIFGKQNAFDFKPKNVGDSIDEDSLSYPTPMHDPESGEQDWEARQETNEDQGFKELSEELAHLRDVDTLALKQKLETINEIPMVNHSGRGDDGLGHRDLESLGYVNVGLTMLGQDVEGDLYIENITNKTIVMVDPRNNYRVQGRLHKGDTSP